MWNITFKGFVGLALLSLFFLRCSGKDSELKQKNYCPYAVNDHLEYSNHGTVIQTDGLEAETDVSIIYEVTGIEHQGDDVIVQFKNFYADASGVTEEYDIKFVYGKKRVYFYSPDGGSMDSLRFELGESRAKTIQDEIDSSGLRHRIQIEEINATVQTRKGRIFEGCMKVVEMIQEPNKPEGDYVFHKISFYKDTILIKYFSVNRMEEDKGIRELRTESELEDYNVSRWR